MEKKKSNRGGVRSGSGRPPTYVGEMVTVTFRMPRRAIDLLEAEGVRCELPKWRVLCELVLKNLT